MVKIKFRAWDKDTKLLLDVNTIDYKKSVAICEHWEFGETTELTFGDIILMQSTGIKDKHDVEIFGGDIVETTWYDMDDNPYRKAGCVTFRDGYFGIRYPDDCEKYSYQALFAALDVEVIGNIYENPELMEEI